MQKTFTLICLGSRGVGKTVFLASNCAEIFRSYHRSKQPQKQWFQCSDTDTQQKIEKMLGYVIESQQYPPATFKITNFNFALLQKDLGRIKVFCEMKWLDIPGEWCDFKNNNFQAALFQSHGCCMFVDTYALLNDEAYLPKLKQNINQVESLLSLLERNQRIQYPIALICTKYDLIESDPVGFIQLEEKLFPLVRRLESSLSIYNRFYSAIPLINPSTGGVFAVKDPGAPLRWITSELMKIHRGHTPVTLGAELDNIRPNLGVNSDENATQRSQKNSTQRRFTRPKHSLLNPAQITLGLIAILSVVGGIIFIRSNSTSQDTLSSQSEQKIKEYEDILQRDPTNLKAIAGLVDTLSLKGDYPQAITRLENLSQKSPKDTYLLTELVELYRATGQSAKLEATYNQIIELESNNMLALLGKAQLKFEQGYLDESKALYEIARTYAHTPELKAEIQALAEKNFGAN